jgi:hypothetical protein
VPKFCSILAALLPLIVGLSVPALAQPSGMTPHVGGPSGNFLGPPSGNAGDFLGDWNFTWDGHFDPRCLCRGRLHDFRRRARRPGAIGTRKEGSVVLHGSVGYDQNVWTGRFNQPDPMPTFPERALPAGSPGGEPSHRLLPARRNDPAVPLDRHAIGLRLALTQGTPAIISQPMDRLFFPVPAILTTFRT